MDILLLLVVLYKLSFYEICYRIKLYVQNFTILSLFLYIFHGYVVFFPQIAAGPLLSDDGEVMVGSCFILEVKSKEEAENFILNDPFYIHGVWNKENISIQRYISLPNGISEYTN